MSTLARVEGPEASAHQWITVVGPNLRDQSKGTFVVHAAGCADLRRGPNKIADNPHWGMKASSKTEVCDEVYPPGDFGCESGDYLDDFHFAPCVKLPLS